MSYLFEFGWSRCLRSLPLVLLFGGLVPSALATPQISTSARDFGMPGSLPGRAGTPIKDSANCSGCHGGYDESIEPHGLWSASMMAQSGRDPIFHAALAIAEQDSQESGYLCLACHAPGAWLDDRGVPTDGSDLDVALGDFDGVNCDVCHRMVDPVVGPNSPAADSGILAALLLPPGPDAHGGQYVIDPTGTSRGPFDLGAGFGFHTWAQSDFHQDSRLCGTCHDISNPIFDRLPNGDWVLNAMGTVHPSLAREDMFPVERTFSEWEMSVFGVTGLNMGDRFGGEDPVVQSCQDCHMPAVQGTAALPGLGAVRPDVPKHGFAGANSWVLRAVDATWARSETGLTTQRIEDGLQRNLDLMQAAADLQGTVQGGQLKVRVVNRSGHKLPTGYGEGRRMWIEVRYLDSAGNELDLLGGYDTATATLDKASTEVFELVHGVDNHMAAQTGIAAGPSFHFAVNNKVLLDNRIPPRGFSYGAFDARGAEPHGVDYMEQQYWRDLYYAIPPRAVEARIRLLHQTTSKEFIEFLRDENVTNSAGDKAHTLWEQFGKSAPVVMGETKVDLDKAKGLRPVVYGLGKRNPQGSYPELSTLGSPSLAKNDFQLVVKGGNPGGRLIVYAGRETTSHVDFGGVLLVLVEERPAILNLDQNGGATIPLPVTPGMVDSSLAFQVLFDDPGTSFGVGMTPGVWVDFTD